MVSKDQINKLLAKVHLPTWLVILLAVVIILRIPSFFEPYSYGDEMIYLSMGEALTQGVPLYKNIHDNKPPLLYITAAVAGNLFWFRALLALVNLTSIILFWKLAKVLFPGKKKLRQRGTILFALLTSLPFLEGNIANAELFMIAPILAAFWLLFKSNSKPATLILSGIFFSLATLYKVPAAFDMGAVVVFWLIELGLKKNSLGKVIQKTFYLLVGFATPILLTLVFFFFQGSLKEYLSAAFLQNIGYLSSWRPSAVQKSFLEKNLPLLIRLSVVVFSTLVLFLARKKLSRNFIFLALWLVFSLFAVTLSERPYPHYLIQIVPSLSFFLAMLFSERSREQVWAIIPLTLAFFVPVYYKFWFYPTFSYYQRFVRFTAGQINKKQYFDSFGSQVERNYKIADFLVKSTSKKDRIFVNGDSAVIYALSRRLPVGKYLTDYHIKDFSSFEEEAGVIAKEKPIFIVLLKEAGSFKELNSVMQKNYFYVAGIEDSQIWRLKGASGVK